LGILLNGRADAFPIGEGTVVALGLDQLNALLSLLLSRLAKALPSISRVLNRANFSGMSYWIATPKLESGLLPFLFVTALVNHSPEPTFLAVRYHELRLQAIL
jgi:hypothetical protein